MDLRLTYSDVSTQVSEYLGTGDIPVDRDLRKSQELVWKGYKRFLFPRSPENGKRHYWSFLEKTATLQLKSGQWVYQLPADFDKIKTHFNFAQQTGYTHMQFVSRDDILYKRSMTILSSYPSYFCIVPDFKKETGKMNELWVYGVPNQDYSTSYSYYHVPPKPEQDTDYFAGGDIYDEVILACCLAEAELKHTKTKGAMYDNARELMAQAVLADQRTKPDGLGLNLDPGIQRTTVRRYLPAIPQNEVYKD